MLDQWYTRDSKDDVLITKCLGCGQCFVVSVVPGHQCGGGANRIADALERIAYALGRVYPPTTTYTSRSE
jgi:hypothetical protein